MSWGAVAGATIATVGGLVASNQSKQAAKGAANAQKSGTTGALAETQRQFDVQMAEYQRKQAQLEKQQAQMTTQLAPYIQGGQSALYEMMALTGLTPAVGATTTGATTAGTTTRFLQPQVQPQAQPLSASKLAGTVAPTTLTAPTAGTTSPIAAELNKGGLSLGSSRWKFLPKTATAENAPRAAAALAVQDVKAQHPDWTTQQVYDEVAAQENSRYAAEQAAAQVPNVPNAVNPYAGMTGAESQASAIERIASSPLLQELTAQGEQALLQNAAATGGVRGGNIQGVLAQFRPQMLQNEIDKQYARLAQLSGMGQSSILSTPMSSPGGVPTNQNLAQYQQDIGSINAGSALAGAQTTGQQIGSIASGLGYGLGTYLNRPTPTGSGTTTNPYTGQAGNQVVGYDAYGNPMLG